LEVEATQNCPGKIFVLTRVALKILSFHGIKFNGPPPVLHVTMVKSSGGSGTITNNAANNQKCLLCGTRIFKKLKK
jgi:hypothetical protein